jgi:hypothetical protein
MIKTVAWVACAAVALTLVIYGAYRTGYVRAYCATKYQAQSTWTGWAGQNAECLISPGIPARTVPVP